MLIPLESPERLSLEAMTGWLAGFLTINVVLNMAVHGLVKRAERMADIEDWDREEALAMAAAAGAADGGAGAGGAGPAGPTTPGGRSAAEQARADMRSARRNCEPAEQPLLSHVDVRMSAPERRRSSVATGGGGAASVSSSTIAAARRGGRRASVLHT